MVTDARVLELARKHLDQGLCFDFRAHITRSTDAELLSFVRAVLAEHEAGLLRLGCEALGADLAHVAGGRG